MQKQDQSPQNQIEQLTIETPLTTSKPYCNVGYLALVVISLCFGPFYYGYNIVVISTIPSKALTQYFGPNAETSVMFAFLLGVVPVGAGLGSLVTPLSMKILTRRNILLVCNSVAIVIAGVIQINNIYVLLGCRFVQGLVIGHYMGVIPLYVKQMTPVPLRGMFGAMSQFFYLAGIVLCYLFGLIFDLTSVNPQFFWRFMFSFTGITVIIQTILIVTNIIPQSPISLIQSKKYSAARKVLALFNSAYVLEHVFRENIQAIRQNNFRIRYRKRALVKPQNLEDQTELSVRSGRNPRLKASFADSQYQKDRKNLNPLKVSFGENQTQRSDKVNIQQLKMDIPLDDAKGRRQRVFINPNYGAKKRHHHHQKITNESFTIDIQTATKVSDVETKKQEKVTITFKAFIIGFQLPLMQQFSGIKIIVAEIGPIIATYNKTLALYFPLFINLVPFICTAFSVLVLARFGRRPIILIGNLGVSLCGFAIGAFFYELKVTGSEGYLYGALGWIVVFTIFFGFTIGPAIWLYVPEIVPARIVPAATCMNWLGVSFCVIATPIIDSLFGGSPYPMFFFFGSIQFVFFILNYFLVIQTKGLEPSKIAEKLA